MYSLFQPVKSRNKDLDEFEMTLASLSKENQRIKAKAARKMCTNKPATIIAGDEGIPEEVDGGETKGAKDSGDAEFVATRIRSKSIVQQLLDRSLIGCKLSRRPAEQWNSCPWISLQTATVTCLTWDDQGILLATATVDNRICIWDWDTVLASDMQGRRDFQKDKIEPIWTFVVPHVVNSLAWSSSDNLAAGFRGSSEVRIYDMGMVAKNLSESGRIPDSVHFLCSSSHTPKHRTPLKLVFLPDNHLIVSYPDGMIMLWGFSCPKNRSATLVWKWKLKEDITSIAPITSSWLLLGGSLGTLIWLDWRKCSRKTFGCDKTPSVVASWDTFFILKKAKPDLPLQHWMGIQAIAVEYNPMQCIGVVGRAHIRWVTTGGFLLSMELKGSSRIQILQAPPKVLTKSYTGELLRQGTAQYTTPSDPVPSHATKSGCCCWVDPQQLTHILPSTDNNVLSRRQMVLSKQLSLSWLDEFNRVHRIPLKKSPKLLIVHPSHQWIVIMSNDDRMTILNARTNSRQPQLAGNIHA